MPLLAGAIIDASRFNSTTIAGMMYKNLTGGGDFEAVPEYMQKYYLDAAQRMLDDMVRQGIIDYKVG